MQGSIPQVAGFRCEGDPSGPQHRNCADLSYGAQGPPTSGFRGCPVSSSTPLPLGSISEWPLHFRAPLPPLRRATAWGTQRANSGSACSRWSTRSSAAPGTPTFQPRSQRSRFVGTRRGNRTQRPGAPAVCRFNPDMPRPCEVYAPSGIPVPERPPCMVDGKALATVTV